MKLVTIGGPMFAGKTQKLVEQYKVTLKNYLEEIDERYKHISIEDFDHENINLKELGLENKILAFTPKRDNRNGIGRIEGRNKVGLDAIAIESIFEIEKYLNDETEHILIDETNFLESEVDLERGITNDELNKRRVKSMIYLRHLTDERRINVNLFGVYLTAEMQPYALMGVAPYFAHERIYLTSICVGCQKEAEHTYFIPQKRDITKNYIGDEAYCPTCHVCHNKWSQKYIKDKEENNLSDYFKEAKKLKLVPQKLENNKILNK